LGEGLKILGKNFSGEPLRGKKTFWGGFKKKRGAKKVWEYRNFLKIVGGGGPPPTNWCGPHSSGVDDKPPPF